MGGWASSGEVDGWAGSGEVGGKNGGVGESVGEWVKGEW